MKVRGSEAGTRGKLITESLTQLTAQFSKAILEEVIETEPQNHLSRGRKGGNLTSGSHLHPIALRFTPKDANSLMFHCCYV